MNLGKVKYEFFVTKQAYDNSLIKTQFVKEVNYLNRINEISEICKNIAKDESVINITYKEYKVYNTPQEQFINHVKKLDEPFTESEIDYGLEAIFQKRREKKTLLLSSDEFDLDKTFDIAEKLNEYADKQNMGVTIIATNPN